MKNIDLKIDQDAFLPGDFDDAEELLQDNKAAITKSGR